MPRDPIEGYLMPITCANCGHQVKKPIKWIRSNSSLQCEGCESDIELETEEFIAKVDRFEKLLKTLVETPKNLKTLNSDKE